MSVNLEKPPERADLPASPGGFDSFDSTESVLTLGALPVGARLVLRCRKDWRGATVIAVSPEKITLAVGSPSGHTYRVRRPPDAALILDGSIPVLCEGATSATWRAGFVRYEARW
ncbi:MAG: hypothetical protein ABR577_08665 [Pyrinomonadaceae bacterium]